MYLIYTFQYCYNYFGKLLLIFKILYFTNSFDFGIYANLRSKSIKIKILSNYP